MAVKTKAPARHQRFGDRLRYWRLKRGLTQLVLGQQMGWKNGSAINQMEKGTYNPTLAIIYRLAEVLGIASAELFTEPTERMPIDLQGLSPPLQDHLTALITTIKHECYRKESP